MRARLNQKTVQSVLLELAHIKRDREITVCSGEPKTGKRKGKSDKL